MIGDWYAFVFISQAPSAKRQAPSAKPSSYCGIITVGTGYRRS